MTNGWTVITSWVVAMVVGFCAALPKKKESKMYFCDVQDDPYQLIEHMSVEDLTRLIVARDDVRRMAAELAVDSAPVSFSFLVDGVTAPTLPARGMVTPEEDVVVSSRAAA